MAASTMSDDDDRRLLASLGSEEVNAILRIKRNGPSATELDLTISGLNEGALHRLGEIVGKATRLKKLVLSGSNQNVARLLAGLGLNRSIKCLSISRVDLGDTRLCRLEPFLKHNQCLTRLFLDQCNLDSESLDLLLEALLERSEDTLECLSLCGNPLGDANLDKLVQVVKRNQKMWSVDLDNNGIGRSGCTSLAELLRDPNSELRCLSLGGNSVDDEGVSVLVESLAKNTKVQMLDLDGNSGISTAGWLSVLKLVCNSSIIDGVLGANEVINRVLNSNHTLSTLSLSGAFYDQEAVARALGTEKANLLDAALRANSRGDRQVNGLLLAARHKIICSHARGDINIGESSIVDDARGVLPDILAWFSGVDHRGTVHFRANPNLIQYLDLPFPDAKVGAIRLDSLFRIVRSRSNELCNVDWEREAKKAKQELAAKEKEIIGLKSEIEPTKAMSVNAQSSLLSSKEEARDAEKYPKEAKAKNKAAKKKKRKQELAAKEKEINGLKSEIERLTSTNESERAKNEALGAETASLKQELEMMTRNSERAIAVEKEATDKMKRENEALREALIAVLQRQAEEGTENKEEAVGRDGTKVAGRRGDERQRKRMVVDMCGDGPRGTKADVASLPKKSRGE